MSSSLIRVISTCHTCLSIHQQLYSLLTVRQHKIITMRTSSSLSLLALSVGLASAQQFCDPDLSDLCFEEKTTNAGITYRFAIPPAAAEGFQTIVQIVAPVEIGWAGMAWSSSMTNGPLTLGWANGEGVVASGRTSEYVLLFFFLLPIIPPLLSSSRESCWRTDHSGQSLCRSIDRPKPGGDRPGSRLQCKRDTLEGDHPLRRLQPVD